MLLRYNKIPEWKYTKKTVVKEEVEKSLNAVKSTYFHCESYSNSYSISKTAGEIKAIMEEVK